MAICNFDALQVYQYSSRLCISVQRLTNSSCAGSRFTFGELFPTDRIHSVVLSSAYFVTRDSNSCYRLKDLRCFQKGRERIARLL
jgi:hypothetical protein